MKLSAIILTALLSVTVMTGAPACTGTITDGGFANPDNGGGDDEPRTPEEDEEELALCIGDGAAGGTCEVTADCDSPMVCLNNTCVGPQDPSYTCDPIEGIDCLQTGESCINGLCVVTPGACETLDDCPNGFTCEAGTCTPERDGTACADPGPGPALAGTYKVDSVLHLRDGLPGVVDGILDVSEKARDIVNGDIDLGLGGVVNTILGGAIAGIIRQFVPPYGIDIVEGLATISDVLDTMRVEGTMELEGEACDGNYRGRHNWDFVTFNMNGIDLRVRPNDLPGVDDVVPEDFAARYHCGDLLIDKHRIQNSMGGLIRWLLDTAAEAITGEPGISMEQALAGIVDCQGVGQALTNASGVNVTDLAAGACQGLVQVAALKVGQMIDEASIAMSLIKLSAVVPVNSDGTMEEGVWYGSLAGGDFLGTLSAEAE